MEPEEDVGSLQQPNLSLPQELITAILVRLPVKYLLQFKCVSTEWFDLISSPEFVKTHLSFSAKDSTRHRLMLRLLETYNPFLTNNNRPSVNPHAHHVKHCSVSSLFNESVTEAFDLDYPMKKPNKGVRIVGSSNGLICLNIGSGRLVLWNPSTRKFKQVPGLVPPTDNHWCRYGFGYDEVHDDYKVVRILCRISNYCVDARICSLKRGEWRRLDDFQDGLINHNLPNCVNGKLYWTTTSHHGWGIVSIGLADEKWRHVEQPCYEEGEYSLKIGVLGSDICVLCNYMRDCWITRVDIWVMKEYEVKESWTRLYTIKCPFDYNNYGPSPPLFMSNKGEILLVFGSTLVLYNPEDDLIRYPEVTNSDGTCLEAELYIESLVCPILLNEPMTQH